MKYLIFIVILLNSCTSYIDVPKNNLNNNYVVFDYNNNQNNFKYINKVNATADHEVYYTTNFSISLPKKIINWNIVDNNFFFEYDSKQYIYIHLIKMKEKNLIIG
ncbi:hypothetical protein [Chryseobacterium sp. G0201]|uniref:hypothetical protein n=1 Tax=Chryseobacterium sp. G0201 TaxID=2487065 RepID=UPI000F4D5BF9|nr:hypothetical protein [Chryseobacterium sp. G0201]AZA54343.1 hypothetical protein EG348_15765 [Chryseobacterium sp. G0201]